MRRRANSRPIVKPEAGDHCPCRRRNVIMDGRVNGDARSPDRGSMGHPRTATVRSYLTVFTKLAGYGT